MSLRALAALAAGAVVLAGCGSKPSPSLIQLRSEGARICTAAGRSLARIPTPGTETGGAAFLKHGISVLTPELVRLRVLVPPANVADVYRSATDALADELDSLHSAVLALGRQHDPVLTFRALQDRLGPLVTQADDAWQALEVPACEQR